MADNDDLTSTTATAGEDRFQQLDDDDGDVDYNSYDPDDFVANAKGGSGGGSGGVRKGGGKSGGKGSSGGVYTAKHTRIKEAQREARNNAKGTTPKKK